jgi:hypothetical protein
MDRCGGLRMRREEKFNYGFLFVSLGLPLVADYFLGRTWGVIAAIVTTIAGFLMLLLGHLDKGKDATLATGNDKARRSRLKTALLYALVCAIFAFGAIGVRSVILHSYDDKPAHAETARPGKAAIYFGEGPGTGVALPMNIFESGVALDAYAGEHKIATLQMKPNGQVKLDVVVNDDTGNPMIEIHDDEFSVSRTDLDRNSSKDEFEVINSDGLVIFQLIRRSPSEVVINGVFKIAGGKSYLLAGPKGALETNVVRYDYVPKPLFKYPSWRFPGQYLTQQ